MPIEVKRDIKRITEQEFHKIDYLVTGLAFAIQNEFGRLWREEIYRNELVKRCREVGFANVEAEVPVFVSHQGFCKEYSVDLLVQDAVVYELKTVVKLNPEHDKQALNYWIGAHSWRPACFRKRFIISAEGKTKWLEKST